MPLSTPTTQSMVDLLMDGQTYQTLHNSLGKYVKHTSAEFDIIVFDAQKHGSVVVHKRIPSTVIYKGIYEACVQLGRL